MRQRIKRAAAMGAAALAVIAGVGAGITLAPTDAAAVSSDKQQVISIDSSSLNGNAVRGTGDNYNSVAMDNSAHFYSSDYRYSVDRTTTGGFPTDGKITASSSNITYQLGWTGTNAYDGNDCIRLVNGDATKTMELSTYGAYEQVYVLATAGGPGSGNYANFTVTLTYTDGTTSQTTYRLYDWYDTTKVTNVEQIASYMRQTNGVSSAGWDGSTTKGPILHSAAIAADKTKLLKSITFKMNGKNNTGSNSGLYSTIYAVTGVVDNAAPATPVATAATNVGSASFTANWNSVSGATSYVIDVATDPNFSNMVAGYNNKNVGNTISTDVSVPNIGNQTYYYRVRAVNSSGQSLSSNVITVNTIAALKVTKTVAAASDKLTIPTKYYLEDGTEVDGFTFQFTVPTTAADGYTAQVYNADGTTAGSSFRITNNYTQTIKGGQYILVYGLAAGDAVTVQELTEDASRAPKGFTLTSRTKGGQEQSGRGNSIVATITAATGATAAQNMLNFTNTYTPTSCTVPSGTFAAKKIFNGREWTTTDRFTIRIKAPAGTPMPDDLDVETDSAGYQVVTKDVTVDNKDDLLTCGAITYTEPGTYYYTLNEAIPTERAEGITYSAAEYRATITVVDDGKGTLSVKGATFVQNLDDDGNPVSDTIDANKDGVYVGTFTNRYDETTANVTAEVTKSYTNNDTGAALEAEQFSFKMEAFGGYGTNVATFDPETVDSSITAPMPQNADGASVTVKNLGDGVATFPAITYTVGDVSKAYVYELTEVNDETAGVTFDSSVYYMVVRVAPNGAGITVTREYYDAEANKLDERPAFTNSYDVLPVTADADSNIKGTKTLDGRSWNEDETYTFTVMPNDATAAAIEAGDVTDVERTVTVSAPESGNEASFTASPVDADAMTFKKSGTYTFTVKESYTADTETSGITYDSHEGKVTYKVTDSGEKDDATGKSKLAVEVSCKDMDFTNSYEASGAFTGVSVTNTLNGRALESGKFSFEVKALSYNGEQPSIDEPTEITIPNGASGEKTVLSNADGTMLLSASTDQGMLGKVQAFAIRETSAAAAGYTFDTQNSGDALVLVEVRAKADKPAELYTVTRVYKGAAVSELLAGGGDLNDDAINSLGEPAQTIDSSATSDKPSVDFVNKYEATLDYGAQSDLQIHVALAYEDGSALTDRTHAFEVIVKPVATDTVTAAEAGEHLTTAPEGKVIETTQMTPSAADEAQANAYTFNLKNFHFGAFTQDDAGKTFAFDTSEVVSTVDVDGYTFDTNTYRTWIAVKDNGDGTLTATTTVKKMNADGSEGEEVGTPYECSTKTKGSATTYVSFTNTYKAYPPADYTPQVVKTVTGKDATESETFSFKMVAADDAATRELMDAGMLIDSTTGKAVASGAVLTASTSGAIDENNSQTVSFHNLVFNKVGIYKFDISEVIPNDVEGWNYDQHVYTLTVTVRDSGGKLTAEAAGSSTQGGNTFSNTFKSTTTLGQQGGFDVEKILHGRTLREGEFTFKAEGDDAASKAKVNLLQGAKDGAATVANEGLDSDGCSVTGLLEGLSFSTADRDEEFSFTITEQAGSVAATTYDTNYYKVKITPYESDEDSGELSLRAEVVKYDKDGTELSRTSYDSGTAGTTNPIVVTFENTYKASGSWGGDGDGALNANVKLTGRDLAAGELHYNVYAQKADQSGRAKVSEAVNAAAKDGKSVKISMPEVKFNLGEGMTQGSIDLLAAVESGYARKTMKDDGTATYTIIFQVEQDMTQMPAGVRLTNQSDYTRTARLVVTDDGKGKLTAAVEYRTGDTTGSIDFNNVYEKVKTVTAAGSAEDLDGKILSAGGTYTYHINWVNNAVDTVDDNLVNVASTVTITDSLPKGVEFVEATDGGTYNDGVVTWTLADRAANSYGTVSVTVRVKSDASVAAATIENQARVSVENGSEYRSNKTSSSVLAKTTSAGDGQKVKVGDTITYTIGYANDTDDSATVTLVDTLPAVVEFVEATDGGTCTDGTVTWALNDVASGETGTVSVTVRVLASAVDKSISNSATMRIGDDVREVQTAKATNYVQSGNLKISKTVTSESGVQAPDATFTFKLTLMDAEGKELPATEQYQYRTSDGTVGYAFNGVEFNLKDAQNLVVSGLPEGYTYRVDETNSTYGFKAEQARFTGEIQAGETSEAAFVNEYTPDEARLVGSDYLKVVKTLSGRAWQQNDKFTFTLVPADESIDTPMPQAGGDTVELTYNKRDGSFGNIDYDEVGTWGYYVTETAVSTDNDANLTSSQAKYLVTVDVTDAGQGSGKLDIDVTATALKDDAGADVNADSSDVSDYTYRFTNTYATAQSLTVSNAVTAGDAMTPSKDQEFSYTIELKYQDNKPVNGEFGGLTFVNGKASFTLKDGESKTLEGLPNNATYTVKQGKVDAYTTKVGGVETLEATGSVTSAAATSVSFTNSYGATATDPVTIGAFVELSGRTFMTDDLDNNTFFYELKENGVIKQGKSASIEAGKSKVKLSFDEISFDKPGTYTYTMSDRSKGDKINGVEHDDSVYTVTVNVIDDGLGKLHATVSYSAAGEDELQATASYDNASEDLPTFYNVYTAEAATATVSGSMTVSPSEGNSYTLKADQFGFKLTNTAKPDGCTTEYPAVTVKNTDPATEGGLSATFTSDTLTFPVEGGYTFTVTEDADVTQGGISASGKVYEVTLEVADNNQGELEVVEKAIYEIGADGSRAQVDSIVFAKSYNPESVTYTVAGSKVLEKTDAGTTRTVKDGEFSFKIAAANDAAVDYLPASTEVSNVGTAYTFGAITYDRVGEYTYTVTEVAGNDSTITYDSHECTVYVKVEDNDGVLTIAESSSVTPADGLTFTNSFTPAPISGKAISGGVSLDGRDADEGEFTIKVTDKDGHTVEVKPGTDGSFSLDAPTFTKTGVYEYTVSQEPGGRGGVTYDNSVYTVTYTVTENPETHELVVERKITKTEGTAQSKDVDAIEFKNTYAPVGTPKADVSAKVDVTGKDLAGGDFTVIVVDKDGNVVAEAKNNADGTVDLSGIELPGPGTYTFTVKELTSDAAGMVTDSKEYTVTIVVTDDLNGGYDVKVSYDGLADGEVPTFSNTYTAPSSDDDGSGKGNGKGGKGTLPGTGDAALALVAGIAAAGAAVAAAGMFSRRRHDA